MRTTILLVEDHHLVRQGLIALLKAQPDLEVVGEASDGVQALEALDRLRPQLLIVDLMLPRLGGLEVARQARARSPETKVILLSMHSSEAYVAEALRVGASGYVLKCSQQADLLQAIREAMAGRRYLSPPLSEAAVGRYLSRLQAQPFDSYDTLTGREREVLRLAADGLSCSEIAARLSISPRTAEKHRANFLRKLGLSSQTDLVRFAIQRGLGSAGN